MLCPRDMHWTSTLRRRATWRGEEGRPSLPFFENQNVVWRVPRRKNAKIFSTGPFFLTFWRNVYQSTLIPRNLPCPEKFLIARLLWRNLNAQDIQNLYSVYFSFYYGVFQKDMKYYHHSSEWRENSAPSNNSAIANNSATSTSINETLLRQWTKYSSTLLVILSLKSLFPNLVKRW